MVANLRVAVGTITISAAGAASALQSHSPSPAGRFAAG